MLYFPNNDISQSNSILFPIALKYVFPFLYCIFEAQISFLSEIPKEGQVDSAKVEYRKKYYVGAYNQYECYTAEIVKDELDVEGMDFLGLRELFGLVDEEIFWIAGKAIQIINWDRTHGFCGQCGSPTNTRTDEYAKVCNRCGLTNYPRISPAIIVAIVKNNKILLAQGSRSTYKSYSVLAGFVEPGETLEECVKREVREEVGIEVKNISYFGSQPWPFPNSLMIAFTAEYESGKIQIDPKEIKEAGWFTADELPPIPSSISISRKLINWFVENNK